MPDQPLQAFAPPTALFNQLNLSGIVSSTALIQWFLYVVLAFWAVYTIVATYHWLKYSHASWVAIPAVAAHLFISFLLIMYTLSGAFFL